MLIRNIASGVLAGIFLSIGGAANAVTVNEIGDAGATLSTFQSVPDGTTRIRGAVATTGADLFGFNWAGGDLELTTLGPGSLNNSQLFLFDDMGFGIAANDEGGPGFLGQSLLTLNNLAAGAYFVAVSGTGNDPLSMAGLIFPDVATGQVGPTGPGGSQPLFSFSGNASGSGTYEISFSEATATAVVPLPAAWLLLISAFGSLAYMRKQAT